MLFFLRFAERGKFLPLQCHSISLYLTDCVEIEGHGPRSGPQVVVEVHDDIGTI